MTIHLVGHLARRGVEEYGRYTTSQQAHVEQLQQDAALYENSTLGEVSPAEMVPFLIIGGLAFFVLWQISYTLGEVISTLTMIETPTRTTIIEPPPPAYTDAPNDDKEPLLLELTDLEITLIDHKPITSKVWATISHLHRIGGYRAQWRGLGLSCLYHGLHNIITAFLVHAFALGFIAEACMYVAVSIGLARVHMAWTHAMIAYPSNKFWWTRLVARKQCKALVLPTAAYAAAQQATIILPLFVAVVLGLVGPQFDEQLKAAEACPKQALLLALKFLAVPVTYAFVGLAILFPASVTLTRIEATLLPEGEETIVPFDKASIVGETDVTARGGCRSLFVQAWRSFDRASRWRLIKLYAKMVLAQFTTFVIAIHLALTWFYFLGIERMCVFFRSAGAQLQLMAIGEGQD